MKEQSYVAVLLQLSKTTNGWHVCLLVFIASVNILKSILNYTIDIPSI
jgi:hypothetical protein